MHKPQHSSFIQTIKICMSFPSYPSVGEPYEKHFPMYLSKLRFLLCQSQALCLKGTVGIFPRFYFYSSCALQINENWAPAPGAVRPLLHFFADSQTCPSSFLFDVEFISATWEKEEQLQPLALISMRKARQRWGNKEHWSLQCKCCCSLQAPSLGIKKKIFKGELHQSHTPAFPLTHTRLSHLIHVVSTQETITVINRPK